MSNRDLAKAFILIVVCLLALFLFVACNGNTTDTQTQSPITNDGSLILEKPDLFEAGTWYDGRVFKILVSGNSPHNDFAYKLDSENVIDRERYNIIKSFRENYGIDVQTVDKTAPSSVGGSGVGYDTLKDDYYSESKTYDAAMLGTYDVANAASHGYLSNMNSDSFSHLDLSKSWWDENALSSLSIDGMVFYATGDISLSENKNTYCVVFNKLTQATSDMEDPYALLESNNWTWDSFSLEVKKAAKSVDCGLMVDADGILAAYISAGASIAETDESGKLELSAYSSLGVSIIDKYTELLRGGDVTVAEHDLLGRDLPAYAITTLGTAETLVELGICVGYLPMPKLTGEENGYRCLVSAYYTQYVCVPYYVSDKELVGGVLEELAYRGSGSITEAYKDSLLGNNCTKSDRNALDIVFSSACFDVGINNKIGGLATSMSEMSYTRTNTFADIYSDSKYGANGEIKEINERYNNIIKSLKYQ